MPNSLLRNIPSVSELLESPPLRSLTQRLSHNVVVSGVRTFLEDLRAEVQAAAEQRALPSVGELAERIARRIVQNDHSALRPVINATGVVLHTGLGRAPLAESAITEMVAAARGYANLELDLGSGRRSQRVAAVEPLLCELLGAEAATVVNNNAGATLVTLAALCAGKEAIVSRGQLVEIGGSFRLPDVMKAGGALLREVGTTNKTRLDDYQRAIGEATGMLLVVHPSNYAIVGFSEAPSAADLVALARQRHIPLVHDIGSGALVDFARYGLPGEPLAAESLRTGVDLVLASGDKLLGGPQSGIIAGRKDLVARIAEHPLARALRVDKLTLAALGATLRLYREPEAAERDVPLLQLLTTSVENLTLRANRLAQLLAVLPAVNAVEVVSDVTYLGGGSLPNQELPTRCLAIEPRGQTVDRFAAALRQGEPAVVGRVKNDRLLFDLRSVFPRQDSQLVQAVRQLGEEPEPTASEML